MPPIHWALVAASFVCVLTTTPAPVRAEEARLAAKLEDVSIIAVEDSVVVRLTTSRRPRYRADVIDGPYRVVIDFSDTTYAWRRTPLVTAAGPLVQVRGSQFRKDVARVVLELKTRVPYTVREEGNSLLVALGMAPEIPTTSASNGRRRVEVVPSAMAQAAPTAPPTSPAPSSPGPAVTAPTPSRSAAGQQPMISLEFKDAEVVNLLRILAAEGGRNIVIGDDVKGRMSISLHNVPWALALQTILEARNLERVDRDGVIRIVSVEQLMKERETRAKIEEAKVKAEVDIRTKRAEADLKEHEAQQRKRAAEAAAAEAIARGPLREEAIRLAYADPGDIANTLQGLLGLEKFTDVKPCRGGDDSETGTVLKSAAIRGPIAEPPFSQLFSPPPQTPEREQPSRPPTVPLSLGITVNCATNTLFLRLYSTELDRMKKLIREALDVPSPQVKIEARMEVLERDDLFAIGVQWGGGGVLAVDGNRNAIVGRGFTSDTVTNPSGFGIPAGGLPPLSNPNLPLGQVIPVSSQTGLPLGGNLINLPIGALLQGAAPAGAGGLTFGIIGSRMNLNLALEALRTQGKTLTLSRPDIVTLENRKARISLGEEIPYATVSSAGTQIQFKLAVLQLAVTPTVVREATRNRIKMNVMVENNSRGTPVNLGTSGAPPAINRRRAETEVVVDEGAHLVIGGVTNTILREEVRKLPLLGDVPFLGWLFKQRGTQDLRRELVLFITPSVLKTETALPPAPAQPAPPPAR
jgi:type IV pilus secretin PilQ/predicted competence protein